jgi:putative SOS response-associated peptidase YedK
VRPIHAKAMPVLLTEAAEWSAWLEGETAEALKLQRPFPADQMMIVATATSQDAV